MANGQTVTEISRFFDFQDGGRPPSWICCAHVRTTHKEHLVVFIDEQNLVGIDAVVSIICCFRLCVFGLKMPIYVPKLFLGDLTPKCRGISTKPKKAHVRKDDLCA